MIHYVQVCKFHGKGWVCCPCLRTLERVAKLKKDLCTLEDQLHPPLLKAGAMCDLGRQEGSATPTSTFTCRKRLLPRTGSPGPATHDQIVKTSKRKTTSALCTISPETTMSGTPVHKNTAKLSAGIMILY